jgi:hypothetical protein
MFKSMNVQYSRDNTPPIGVQFESTLLNVSEQEPLTIHGKHPSKPNGEMV